jgi:hypothetical protein
MRIGAASRQCNAICNGEVGARPAVAVPSMRLGMTCFLARDYLRNTTSPHAHGQALELRRERKHYPLGGVFPP